MRIKNLSLAAIAALSLGLTACSTDEPGGANNGSNAEAGERLHAKIQLFLPSTTRSSTIDYQDPTNSSDGFEIGQTYENNVNNVTIALATFDATTGKYTPITISATSAAPVDGFDAAAPVYSINFRQDEIVEHAEETVYIFAFCNADGLLGIGENFDPADFDLAGKILSIAGDTEANAPWKSGDFLMANAPNKAIPFKVLPDKTSLERNYSTPEKALDLGSVDVARVVSRFDFKQTADNIYPVYDVNETDKTPGNQMADVKILAMAPITLAKDYYLLPRVSDDGTDSNWTLCGTETRQNWVVSPNWTGKSGNVDDTLLGKYLYQSFSAPYTDENYYKFTTLADFEGADDNDENWGASLEDNTGYKIWRYVTENTLPAVQSQRKGISTGVLFKSEIINPKAGSTLAKAMENGADIYSFNGTIYGSLASLRATAAMLDASNPLRVAFEKVFPGKGYLEMKDVTEGNVIKKEFVVAEADLVDCTAAENVNTFKIYRATKDNSGQAHYYVYYLYRNRHFDNGNPSVMNPMEFGTVRNNIYKLAITTISEFGHPGNPDDDNDPEDPEDPDEDPKTYLKVMVRVVPWMVRVNNIEF